MNKPVALRSAKADIGDNLRQTDAADQLALRVPYGHAIVPDGSTGIARAPQIAVDIATRTVWPALYPVDHEIGEELLVGELVVGTDVEDVHVTLSVPLPASGAPARGTIRAVSVFDRRPVSTWEQDM